MNIFLIVSFFFFSFVASATFFPHIVWLYWDQGQAHLTQFGKACFTIIKSLHQNTSWEIRLVDKMSIKKWLDEKEFQELNQIFNKKRQLPIQIKVDFYRLFLIRKYGGVWLDIGIILHQNLDWLQDLRNNPYVINKQLGQKPQIFYFYTHRAADPEISLNYQGKTIYSNIDIENFMFAAVKQSRYIKDLIQEFKIIVLQGKLKYQLEAQNFNIPFQYKPYYSSYLANDVIQFRTSKSFKMIKREGNHFPIQNFYQIWGINRFIGPYHQGQFKWIRSLFQNQPRRGDYAKYLTKIHHFGPQQFMDDMLSGNYFRIEERAKVIDNFTLNLGKTYLPHTLKCLYQFRIYQNSIVNKYFLSKLDRKTFYPNAIVVQDSQLPYICTVTNLSQLKSILQKVYLWASYSLIIFLFIECFVQFLYCFKISQKISILSQLEKEQFKFLIFQKILLCIIVQTQMHLIHLQYSLWIYESPTAFFVAFIYFLVLILVIRRLLFSQTQFFSYKIHVFLFVFLLMVLQYYITYKSTVWQYQGPIYNFQLLREMNKETLKQFQRQIWKLIVLILLEKIFQGIKSLFKLNIVIQNKKEQYTFCGSENQDFSMLYES